MTSKMGKSKQYSELDDCEDNGWLHTDDAIRVGVQYKVRYLGSMEIGYSAGDSQLNNNMAVETMRKVKELNIHHDNLFLCISMGSITLSRASASDLIMRHSTSRIAYSTVDSAFPTTFCYVALPRTSKIAVCHVFKTKSPKISYEMTFTCAQAFDANYSNWQKDTGRAALKARASENGDIDARDAIPSPEVRRKMLAVDTRERSSSLRHVEAAHDVPVPATPEEVAARQKADEDVGYIEIGQLEIEEEDEMERAAHEMYSRSHTADSLVIGVEPMHYNEAEEDDDEDE